MRRLSLLLCALVLALAPIPARAGSTADVTVTAYTIAPNYVTAVMQDSLSGRSFGKAWQNGSWGPWTRVDPAPPGVDGGNISGIRVGMNAAFLAQPQDGRIYCDISGSWNAITSNWGSGLAPRATPIPFNEGGDGFFGPGLGIAAVGSDSFVRYLKWAGDLGCDPSAVQAPVNTGGKTDWNAGAAGTLATDFVISMTGQADPSGNTFLYWQDTLGSLNLATDQRGITGQCTSGPAVTTWGGRRYDLFCRGRDAGDGVRPMWHMSDPIFHTGPGWENLGGNFTTGPGCASWQHGRIDCFAAGLNGDIYHAYFDGFPGAWHVFPSSNNYWEDIGAP